MSALSVADVLDRAADLIEPEGAWIQGRLCEDGCDLQNASCFCAMGAILRVGSSSLIGRKSVPVFEASLPSGFREYGAGLRPAADWNDAPERTQGEVVAKLREAAAKAREQGL